MRSYKLHLLSALCLVFAIFTFSGCDDDYFDDFDDYYPPHHDQYRIDGQWIINHIDGKYCSYNINEEWIFYSNGTFETVGYENLNEFGRWRQSYENVEVRFDHQDRLLDIRIEDINRYHMVVQVRDKAYDGNSKHEIKYRLYLDKTNDPWYPRSQSQK